jgi:hypothetical protein
MMENNNIKSPYYPSVESLKFITFIRASGNETHSSPEAGQEFVD